VFGDDRCPQFRVIVVTDPQTHPPTNKQTGPITIHCVAASAQYKYLCAEFNFDASYQCKKITIVAENAHHIEQLVTHLRK